MKLCPLNLNSLVEGCRNATSEPHWHSGVLQNLPLVTGETGQEQPSRVRIDPDGASQFGSVLGGEHDGEHARRSSWVGRVGCASDKFAVEIVDLEEYALAVEFDRSEIMLAVGVVVGGEPIERANCFQDCGLGHFGQRQYAGCADNRAADEMLAQLIVEFANAGALCLLADDLSHRVSP